MVERHLRFGLLGEISVSEAFEKASETSKTIEIERECILFLEH
jgi:hypothetical protein